MRKQQWTHRYILVCMAGIDVNEKRVGARHIAEARLAAACWPLYENTSHAQRFSSGDQVLIYVGSTGDAAQTFIGQARIARIVRAPVAWKDPGGIIPSGQVARLAELEQVELWNRPVSIRDHIDDLTFVKNRMRWGLHLMGGVRQIPESDFRRIVRAGAHSPNPGLPTRG
jgi:hypothetical protein